MSYDRSRSSSGPHFIAWGIGITVVLVVLFILANVLFGYIWHSVGSNEIAIQFNKSQITDIVGPGIYSELNMWADITNVKIEGVVWCAEDVEVITRDQQRLGVKACGTVHRPGLEKAELYKTLWSQYQTIYISDDALVGSEDGSKPGLITNIAQQAMKVCVGDRNFSEAVVGTARDELRTCMDTEVDELVSAYGLRVENLTVPNIIIGPAVQTLLDEITNAKFQTQKAEQEVLKAKADAERRLAEEQGKIMVEQGIIQETERQQAVTADIQRQRLEAQQAVIQAQKDNELKEAQLELQVVNAQLEVAKTQAQSALTEEAALAALFQVNPAYADYMAHLATMKAWGNVEKIIVPAGAGINSILSPTGDVNAVVDVGN